MCFSDLYDSNRMTDEASPSNGKRTLRGWASHYPSIGFEPPVHFDPTFISISDSIPTSVHPMPLEILIVLDTHWLYLWPFPRPRDFFPVAVRPRASLCLWTGSAIQLIRASLCWWIEGKLWSAFDLYITLVQFNLHPFPNLLPFCPISLLLLNLTFPYSLWQPYEKDQHKWPRSICKHHLDWSSKS